MNEMLSGGIENFDKKITEIKKKKQKEKEEQIEQDKMDQDQKEKFLKQNILKSIQSFNKENLSNVETVTKYDQIIETTQSNEERKREIEEETREYFDSDENIKKYAIEVASHLKNSKHTTIYTGAGISTSAKIPDYRGPKGVWTLQSLNKENEIKSFDIEQAFPTYAHYAIAELIKKGLVHHVVSTVFNLLK
jgi:hypothetical protein